MGPVLLITLNNHIEKLFRISIQKSNKYAHKYSNTLEDGVLGNYKDSIIKNLNMLSYKKCYFWKIVKS